MKNKPSRDSLISSFASKPLAPFISHWLKFVNPGISKTYTDCYSELTERHLIPANITIHQFIQLDHADNLKAIPFIHANKNHVKHLTSFYTDLVIYIESKLTTLLDEYGYSYDSLSKELIK